MSAKDKEKKNPSEIKNRKDFEDNKGNVRLKRVKKYVKCIVLAISITVFLILGVLMTKGYIEGLKGDIHKEQGFQVEANQDLKESIIKNQELEKQLQRVKDENEDQVYNMEIQYSADINRLENELNSSYEYRDQLETTIHDFYYGVKKDAFIINSEIKYHDEIIEEEHDFTLNSEIIVEFAEGHDYYYVIDQMVDGDFIYMALEMDDDYVSLVRCNNDLSKIESGKDLVEIVYTFEDDRGYMGRFSKTSEELVFKLKNTFITINPDSGDYNYSKSYNQYKEIESMSNDSVLSVDKNDTLRYSYMGVDKDIYYGFNEYTKNRGGGTVFVPFKLSKSVEESYYSYYIGYYESASGPYILNESGELIYTASEGDYGVDGRWISDSEYLDIQNVYNGYYIRIIDVEKGLKTTLSNGPMVIVTDFDGGLSGLCYRGYDENSYVQLYTSNSYNSFIKINLPGLYNEAKISASDNLMYTSEVKDNKLIIKNYTYEVTNIISEELETTTFLTSENYTNISGNLFFSKTQKDSLGNPRLSYLSEDHKKMIDVSSLDDLSLGKLYLDYDDYNWNNILLFDHRIMIDEYSGKIVGLDALTEVVGSKVFDIIAADRGHDLYAYIIAKNNGDRVEIGVYVSFESEKFELIHEIEVDNMDFDVRDWNLSIPDGSTILYDSVSDQGDRLINKYKPSTKITSIFIEGYKNPRTLVYNERVRVLDLNNEGSHFVSLQGKIVHSFDEVVYQTRYSYREGLFYITNENGVEECVILSERGEELARVETYDYEVYSVENVDSYIRVHLLEWINMNEFVKHMIEIKISE